MTDPITPADLHAFVDDQLDIARRIEVEDHLSRHPDAAARVMADMRTRDALSLAFGAPPADHPPLPVLDAARRLDRALLWRRVGSRFQRAASVALLIGAGWFGHAQVGVFEIADSEAAPRPSAFVEDARHAHETALIRARMASQPEVSDYDPAEIRAETGITLPTLPREWRVVDAQVFPSRFGHSVEIEIEDETLGRVSLFAARGGKARVAAPTLVHSASGTTVHWQSGEDAFALTGTAPDAAMQRAASGLDAGRR